MVGMGGGGSMFRFLQLACIGMEWGWLGLRYSERWR